MIESRDRSLAGMTAPAQGLALWRVYYGPKPEHGAAPAGEIIPVEDEG
jgi:hypothetical protein